MKTLKKLVQPSLLFSLALFLSYCSKDNGTDPDPDPDPIGETPIEIEEVASVPLFKLTSPLRSAFLQEGTTDDMNITVQGEACDDINPIAEATINEASVVLTGTGDCKTFNIDLNSTWGLNTIDGVAKNDLGDEVSIVQSYLRSSEYFPAPGTTDVLANARRARLGPNVLDDQDRSDADDFASLLKIVIENSDIDSAIPEVLSPYKCYTSLPIVGCVSSTKVLKNGTFNLGDVTINSVLALEGGLIKVDLSISETTLPLTVETTPSTLFNQNGNIGFENIDIVAIYNVTHNGDAILVSLQSNDTTLSNFFISGFSGLSGVIINIVTPLLSGPINNMVQNSIDSGLTLALKDFESILGQMLNDFNLEPSIIVPAPIAMELLVASGIDHLEVGAGFIDLGLGVRVEPAEYKKNAAQLAYGSIIGASTIPTFEAMNGSFGMGIKNDDFNQVLWAVWAGGGFDTGNADNALITGLLSSNALDAGIASIETKLPPVLTAVGDVGSQVKISIGDILIKAKINPLLLGLTATDIDADLSVYVSLALTGTFELVSETGKMRFVLSSEPETHVQIQDYVRTPEAINLESKLGDFTSELIKLLISASVAAVELPTFPVDGLPGVEPGTVWALGSGTIAQASGYINFDGEIGVKVE